MIATAQLEGLRFDQIEKDYVILWLLSGLAHPRATEHGWVFSCAEETLVGRVGIEPTANGLKVLNQQKCQNLTP